MQGTVITVVSARHSDNSTSSAHTIASLNEFLKNQKLVSL